MSEAPMRLLLKKKETACDNGQDVRRFSGAGLQ